MDGGQGAGQAGLLAQFGQGQIGLGADQSAQLAAVGGEDFRLAAREAVPRGDVAGAAALLEEFFDQAERDSETVSDFVARRRRRGGGCADRASR